MAAEPEKTLENDAEAGGTAAGDEAENSTEGDAAGENRRARRAAMAQARKQRVRERREAEAVGLDAQEVLDEALVRSTDTAAKFMRRHSTLLQGLLAGGLLAWAAWGGYGLYVASARAEASDVVAEALAIENARVGDPEELGQPDEQGIVLPGPIFETDEARLAAAREALQKAAAVRADSGTAHYARLALAAVLLDQGKYDEAAAEYRSVADSGFAKTDPELRGRALEGIALTLERKGDEAAALDQFGQVAQTGLRGFVLPALLDQARLQHALGKTEEAKATLKQFRDEHAKLAEGGPGPSSYLSQRAQALTREIDPVAAKEFDKPMELTPERLKELQEQVQKALGGGADSPESNDAP